MRKFSVLVIGILAVLVGGSLLAETVTLPAAASIVGGAPFFSDVRAFNTSYTSALTVDATYRCFIPSPCTPTTPTAQFTLAPRESRAFDDIVVSLFNAPNTAGGVEFVFTGDSGQLVVTSRLFSTAPTPTVGMFIAGLDNSEAFPTTVLTSIRNGGSGAGFRTNVGLFNPQDSAADVTFTVFDGGNQVGNPVTVQVAGHSGAQVNGIFNAAGDAGHSTENAVIVVSSTQAVFSYAAVIDNGTTDPIFVLGAQDLPQQPITPSAPTATPTPGAASPTPTGTPALPTPTPTPTPGQPPATRNVTVGAGGSLTFRDEVSNNNSSTITVGQTIQWNFTGGLTHNVTSSSAEPFVSPNMSSGTFSHTFNTAGTFTYLCTIHGQIMSGTVHVNP